MYKISEAEKRRAIEITKNSVKCKCGCVSVFQAQTDRIICRWCGNWLYRTPQLKFKYEMKERLNK